MGLAAFNRARKMKSEREKQNLSQQIRETDEIITEYPVFGDMTDEQLAEIAAEKGIDLAKAKSRTQLIKLLEK